MSISDKLTISYFDYTELNKIRAQTNYQLHFDLHWIKLSTGTFNVHCTMLMYTVHSLGLINCNFVQCIRKQCILQILTFVVFVGFKVVVVFLLHVCSQVCRLGELIAAYSALKIRIIAYINWIWYSQVDCRLGEHSAAYRALKIRILA